MSPNNLDKASHTLVGRYAPGITLAVSGTASRRYGPLEENYTGVTPIPSSPRGNYLE